VSTTVPVARVCGLHVYPVKSLAGVACDSAGVAARGLVGDRRWGIVDPSGEKVTAREAHGLLALTASPLPDGGVRLTDRSGAEILVEPPREATPMPVSHSGQGTARPAGDEAAAWLSARLDRAVRLVWQDDASRRPIRPDLGGRPEDVNSLADAAPLLLTTEASLRRLNAWVAEGGTEAIGHDRFRPNVVVDGGTPFAEDSWDDVTIGSVPFRRTMVCDRCVMTTIDRDTLGTSKEPIRTLARHRKWDGATWFGIRLTPVLPVPTGAVMRVGDEVTIAAGRPA
jgi:uncharacterized protein YcbX